jgi:hypothetical protein
MIFLRDEQVTTKYISAYYFDIETAFHVQHVIDFAQLQRDINVLQ